MPFLKVLPAQEPEQEQIKYVEVSPVYEPDEFIIESAPVEPAIQEQESEQGTPEPEQKPEESTLALVDESTTEPETPEPTPITPEEPEPPQDDTTENIDVVNTPDEASAPVEELTPPEPEQEPEQEPETPEPVSTPITPEEPAPPQDDTLENVNVVDKPEEEKKPEEAPKSGTRYVDLNKTDFDKMLDELASISKDIIEHETEKFAKKCTVKFHGDFDKDEADAKKYTAFLGGYITNSAMLLCDLVNFETAISKLEEVCNVLKARKKIDAETAAIRTQVEEEGAVVDLSDILGLFGDG